MKNKLPILLIASLFFLPFCANPHSQNFQSILNSQPYVVDIQPPPYQILDHLDQIVVNLSKPVMMKSVTDKSIFVVEGTLDPKTASDPKSLSGEVDDGKLKTLSGTTSLSPDSKTLTWSPNEPLSSGSVTLVITPQLEGDGNVPFNQKPGENPSAFIGTFFLPSQEGVSDPSSSPINPSGGSPQGPPKIRPDFLVLNEILYDASASDTDGNEFIELYGTPGSDIDGYQVILVNGSDGGILKVITLPENTKIPDDGIFVIADARTNQPTATNIPVADLIENFDPQNGPDAVQLLDPQGRLVDTVAYGAGNIAQAQNGLATGEGSPAPDAVAGHSISRVGGKDTDDNSKDFVDLAVPTPGTL
jgi:hypothetical protein